MIFKPVRLAGALLGFASLLAFSSCEKSETYGSPTGVVEGSYNAVNTIFAKNRSEEQVFEVDATQPINIKGKYGTEFNFPANAFKREFSNSKITTMTLKIVEVYKKSDMVMWRVGTSSANNLLQAAGMVHISAVANKDNLLLADGKEFTVRLAPDADMGDMLLFTGTIEPRLNQFDWVPYPADTTISNVTIDMDNKYNMMCHTLGWLGCQQYYNAGAKRTQIYAEMKTARDIDSKEYYMIYEKDNVAVRMYPDKDNGIPSVKRAIEGDGVTFLAVGEYIDRFYAGFDKQTIKPAHNAVVQVVESTEQNFLNRIRFLD